MPRMRHVLVAGVIALASVAVASEVAVGVGASHSSAQPTSSARLQSLQPFTTIQANTVAPRTSLSLGTTLHLIDQTNGFLAFDNSHHAFTAGLTKRGSGKPAGAASYTCANTSPGVQQCKGALALRGGVLLVTLSVEQASRRVSGQVNGGNGSYSGAHGSLTGHLRSQSVFTLTVNFSVH